MKDEEVLAIVIEAIGRETGNPPAEITPEMTANDVPGWDSLAHIRILLEIGVKLGVPIDIEKTYLAATIRDLVPVVTQSLRAP